MFDKIENEDYIIENISNNIEDDENSFSNSEEEVDFKDENGINIDKKNSSDDVNDNSSDDNFAWKKENKIIYPKKGNNNKTKNNKNNNKGYNKNGNKHNLSNEVLFISKDNFNPRILIKKTYNDMITEQIKIFWIWKLKQNLLI